MNTRHIGYMRIEILSFWLFRHYSASSNQGAVVIALQILYLTLFNLYTYINIQFYDCTTVVPSYEISVLNPPESTKCIIINYLCVSSWIAPALLRGQNHSIDISGLLQSARKYIRPKVKTILLRSAIQILLRGLWLR